MGLSILAIIYTYFGRLKDAIKHTFKSKTFWVRVLGCAIPGAFLVYVLYINFLPFGFEKSYIINVGTENDTAISEFYLEPSQSLSEKKITGDGLPYREIYGLASAIFKPNSVLKNTSIRVQTEDEGVNLISPSLDLDLSRVNWEYSWDFTKNIPPDLTSSTAFVFDNGTFLNGTSRLELPNSSNNFEKDSFTVYAEWKPENQQENFQEIVGHYNWELLQEKNKVRFLVGRMLDKDGPSYSVEYTIEHPETFFNATHTALAIYNSDPKDGRGSISLYVDGRFSGRAYFGSYAIWADYNGKKNLTFGKSYHGIAKSYKGYLYKVNITNKNILEDQKEIDLVIKDETEIKIPIEAVPRSNLKRIFLYVDKE